MADNLANLEIFVQSDSVRKATTDLDNLAGKSKKAETATSKFRKGLNSLGTKAAAAGIVALTGTIIGLQKAISKTREFQVLQAGLKTATGSVENAQIAFSALKKIAIDTPYGLAQATTAFTKLVNYGLTPSREAIISYGDTASALGKSLEQMVEAVADAATGEFERLKEFGIKASKEGDKVTFTFRGIKTEVANNAEAIEGYLIKLGQNNFAGAMEDRMKTLDGAFANLEDAWEQLLFTIGNDTALGDIVGDGVRRLGEEIESLTATIQSAAFQNSLAQLMELGRGQFWQLGELGKAGKEAFDPLTTLIESFVDGARRESEDFDRFWEDVFGNIPINLATSLRMATLQMDYFVPRMQERFRGLWDNLKLDFVEFIGDEEGQRTMVKQVSGGILDRALAQGYSPLGGGPPSAEELFQAEMDKLVEQTDAIKRNAQAFRDRAAAIRGYREGGDLFVGPLRPDGFVAPEASADDPLKQFRVGGSDTPDPYDTKGAKKAKVVKEPRDVFSDEYQYSLFERPTDNLIEQLAREEREIFSSYERRKQEILRMTDITESERATLLAKAHNEAMEASRYYSEERNKAYLQYASDFFGDLATISSAFGKKGHRIAQAAAIAQTTMDTYASATAAYKSLVGTPYIGPYIAPAAAMAAIASGFSNIQKIRSTPYAGAYESGGIVPGTSFSGDRMNASVNSGEMILNRSQQKELFKIANGNTSSESSQSSQWKIVVNNLPGQDVEISEDRDNRIVTLAVKRTKAELTAEANNGGGTVFPAFVRKHNLKRQN